MHQVIITSVNQFQSYTDKRVVKLDTDNTNVTFKGSLNPYFLKMGTKWDHE